MVNCISLVRLGVYYKWYDSYEPYGSFFFFDKSKSVEFVNQHD